MEELTELINKYKEENNILNTDMDGQLEIGKYIYVNYPCAERLCSKKFGFIKRLVKHDKIDFKTFGNAFGTKYLEYPIGSDNYDQVYDYKDIIKWLAISDTPIEDLIYYLKE